MVETLKPDQRCDWWRVIQDLHMHGLTVDAIQTATGIPRSTLLGYKNLAAEPKYADGQRLLALWQRRMHPPVPMITGSIRQRRVVK